MPQDADRGMLIAETGEDGEVTHVWMMAETERFPRPLMPGAVADTMLDDFEVFGAPSEAVGAWLKACA